MTKYSFILFVFVASCTPAQTHGQSAPLFDSVDENLNPVSMADMIDGRPLVLAVSSCT